MRHMRENRFTVVTFARRTFPVKVFFSFDAEIHLLLSTHLYKGYDGNVQMFIGVTPVVLKQRFLFAKGVTIIMTK